MIEPEIIEIKTFGKNRLGKDITGGYEYFVFEHSGIIFYLIHDRWESSELQELTELKCLIIETEGDFLEINSKNKSALSEIYNWFLTSKMAKDIKNITLWRRWIYSRHQGNEYFEPFGENEEDNDFEDYLIYLEYYNEKYKQKFDDGKKRRTGMDQKIYNLLISLVDNEFLTVKQNNSLKNFLSMPEMHPSYVEKLKSDIGQPGHIYLIHCQNYYKIGKSKNYNSRKKHFDTIMPLETDLIHSFQTNDMNYAEKYLHNKYKHLHHKGEWFNLTQKEINEICSISDFQL